MLLQPRHRQSEHFGTSQGVMPFDKASAEGGNDKTDTAARIYEVEAFAS